MVLVLHCHCRCVCTLFRAQLNDNVYLIAATVNGIFVDATIVMLLVIFLAILFFIRDIWDIQSSHFMVASKIYDRTYIEKASCSKRDSSQKQVYLLM